MFAAPAAEFPNDNHALHAGACWVLASLDEGLVAEVATPPSMQEREVVKASIEEAPAPEAPALEAIVEAPALVLEVEIDADVVVVAAAVDGAGELGVEPGAPVGEVVAAEAEADLEPTVPTPRVSETVAVRSVDGSLGEETPAPPSETRRAVGDDGFARFVDALVEIAVAEGAEGAAVVLPALLGLEAVEVEAFGPGGPRMVVSSGFGVETDGLVRASARLEGLVRAWGGVLRRTGDFSACGSETLNEWAADLLAAVLGDAQRASAMQYQLRRRGVAAFGMVQLAA